MWQGYSYESSGSDWYALVDCPEVEGECAGTPETDDKTDDLVVDDDQMDDKRHPSDDVVDDDTLRWAYAEVHWRAFTNLEPVPLEDRAKLLAWSSNSSEWRLDMQ